MNEPNQILRPLGGLLLDMLSMLRNQPFVPHSMTKLRNLKYCKLRTGADSVIEIGTYKGVTAKRLSRFFVNVFTIEINEQLHREAKKNLSKRPNVECLLGDAINILPDILNKTTNVILFCDGHYSGGNTGFGDKKKPILQELDIIQNKMDDISAIVIDDFRLFGVDEDWPQKSEVFSKIEKIFSQSKWEISVLNDQILIIKI